MCICIMTVIKHKVLQQRLTQGCLPAPLAVKCNPWHSVQQATDYTMQSHKQSPDLCLSVLSDSSSNGRTVNPFTQDVSAEL